MDIKESIRLILKKQGKKPIGLKELSGKAQVKKGGGAGFLAALEEMKGTGEIFEQRHKLMLSATAGLVAGKIVRVNETYGFARPENAEKDAFIPGKFLLGAMPDDIVLLKLHNSTGELMDGEVISILNRAEYLFSGVVSRKDGRYEVTPDRGVRFPIAISRLQGADAADGEKVVARLSYRGDRHFNHRAQIVNIHGSSENAQSCCEAILEAAGISREFPEPAMAEARAIGEKGIHPKEIAGRTDLRDEIILPLMALTPRIWTMPYHLHEATMVGSWAFILPM